ncbi:transposable element Tc1 transposase [Trichonephila clavipes]|nr:transposable element Tc1 transposase [Trichonephila clavipes]
MGRSDAAIRRCWQEWVANGRFQRHDGSGRPRAIADREDRLIFISAVIAPDSSSSAIRRVTRTRWCLARPGWNHADWGRKVFNDESHLQQCPDDHRRRVWRRPGQHANPAFTIAYHTGPQPGVMVWGTISFDSRTVLLSFLLQYPLLIFQQDNARPTYGTCFYELSYSLSNTSLAIQIARSLSNRAVFDLMRMRLHLPGNVDDLARQLEQIWQEISQKTIRVLYHSIPRRVAACIQA